MGSSRGGLTAARSSPAQQRVTSSAGSSPTRSSTAATFSCAWRGKRATTFQLGRAVAPLGTCSAIAVATALPANAPPRKWQRHNFTACRPWSDADFVSVNLDLNASTRHIKALDAGSSLARSDQPPAHDVPLHFSRFDLGRARRYQDLPPTRFRFRPNGCRFRGGNSDEVSADSKASRGS